jgi:hypothetical protein
VSERALTVREHRREGCHVGGWAGGQIYRWVSLVWHLNDSVLYTFLSGNNGS